MNLRGAVLAGIVFILIKGQENFVGDSVSALLEDISFIKQVEMDFINRYKNLFPPDPYDTANIENLYKISIEKPLDMGVNDYLMIKRFEHINRNSIVKLKYNRITKEFLNLYLVKRKSFTEKLIALSRYFFPLVEEYLDKYQLPLELKYLLVIESAFNPFARSIAGAVGPWQFIYSTAKIWGLEVNSIIDERRDLRKSTEAACKFLKFLYDTFGDWELAIAAYNCGPYNVIKAQKYAGKNNFWEIWPYLPKETRGYVPALYAVIYAFNYYKEHGLNPPKVIYEDIFIGQVDTVMIDFPISLLTLAKILNIDTNYLLFLNSMYKVHTIIASPSNPYPIYLPVEYIGFFIQHREEIKNNFSNIFPSSAYNDSIFYKMAYPKVIYHKVKHKETISMIAKKYKCSKRDIIEWNNLKDSKIRPGMKLKIVKYDYPSRGFNTSQLIVSQPDTSKYFIHIVKNGETLSTIAALYGISIDTILQINKLQKEDTLIPGIPLLISTNNEQKRSNQ